MEIRVETLPPEGEAFTFEADEAILRQIWDDPPELEQWHFSPARARVHVTKAHEGVELEGLVEVAWEAPCKRCLAPVEGSLEAPVRTRFETEPQELARDGTPELNDAAFLIAEYDGEKIEGIAWLAEQVSVLVPDDQLCDPDCKGLCSQCGANLNETECDCTPAVDPRWSALAELKS